MKYTLILCSALYLAMGDLNSFAIDIASEAAPGSDLSVLDDFQAELIYSVPASEQGSWVSLAVDPYGRLIASDQHGKLYRVTPPSVSGSSVVIEPIELEIGRAHGLLCAFGSLYVMVNGKGAGLYRVRDTDGDDRYDDVQLLRAIDGGGEHGPHAIVLSPDRRSLYVCAGNHTPVPNAEKSLIPRHWGEDLLLPRQWDAGGHATGILAPAGWIARTDPDGKEFELFCNGFRNEYDIAFNTEGELFTYDADMEWDVGAPWYRPTRVNHCTSGAEFGWRSGTGKWPKDYPDSLGSVVDIGPGSPTGVAFGTGARFPHKYQRAMYISDWSYGVIYAVQMTPEGSSYVGEREPFVSGAPLPVTDMVVNPQDRALYFTIGGRGTQSGLYRVTYTGREPTTSAMPVIGDRECFELRQVRRRLEALHYAGADNAVETAWPYLSHEDRAIRFAARIAVEHQPVSDWYDRAISQTDPVGRTYAIIALARSSQRDPELLQQAITVLLETSWSELDNSQRVDQLRAISLCLIRLAPEDGQIDGDLGETLASYLAGLYPADVYPLNRDLSQLYVYLRMPRTTDETLELLENSPTQEEQLHFASVLRTLKVGWSMPQRERYFRWFNVALARARGGHSFNGFLKNIRDEAAEALNDAEKTQLEEIIAAEPELVEPQAVARTKLVRPWSINDLLGAARNELTGRDFQKGRRYFTDAGCYKCHRYSGDGGNTGPDLTATGTRFDHRTLLESLLEPSKVVSDQYQASRYFLEDGRVVVGRVVNMGGNNLHIMENMLDPGRHTTVDRNLVEEIVPSETSMMPTGLLDTFEKQEILDLLAFLRSGGNPDHDMFKKNVTGGPDANVAQ